MHSIDIAEMQHHVLARRGPIGRLRVDFDALDKGRLPARNSKNVISNLDSPAVEATGNGKRVLDTTAEDIRYCQTERFLESTGDRLGGLEKVEEDRASVPRRVGIFGTVYDIGAGQPGTGDESEVSRLVPRSKEESCDLLGDFVETGSRPSDGVEFVDGDDEPLHAEAADQEGVFFRLAFEARFEVTGAGVDDKDGEVGLGGAGDHVGDEVAMTGSVENGEGCGGGFEFVHGDVDGDAAAALFASLIQDPGQCEGGFADAVGFFSISVEGSLVNHFEVVEETAHQGAFAGIDVTWVYQFCFVLFCPPDGDLPITTKFAAFFFLDFPYSAITSRFLLLAFGELSIVNLPTPFSMPLTGFSALEALEGSFAFFKPEQY